MKLLFILCSLLSFQVNAKAVGELPNKSGGKIVFTDDSCKYYPKAMRMYTYAPSGGSNDGCWFIEDNMVVVVYEDDKKTYRYPLNQVLTPSNK